MKKFNTLKFDGLGIVRNMTGKLLFLSKTNFLLVVDKLFPRFDDGLGKCMLHFYTSAPEMGTASAILCC